MFKPLPSDYLVCPVSKHALHYDAERQALVCDKSGLIYPIRNSIPVLLADEAQQINTAHEK